MERSHSGWIGPHLSLCNLSKKTGDSNVTLQKMVLLSIYLVSKQHMGIHWVKESSGSLVDVHVSVI